MPQSISTGPPCAAALPPRLKEVSHGRGGWRGGSQPPWKGPGAAAGPCVRFLLASQANHSQQLSPCLAAPLMCFLLAEQTSQAAAECGEHEGGKPGKPDGA